MFWAGFGHGVCTGLVPLDGDPDSPCGGVTSRVIHDVYSAFLPELVEPGDIFMHDNAPVHTAGIIRQLLAEMQIEVMIWPPYSPDLNPIENLWALMKAVIYKRYPELEYAPDTEETLIQLIEAAKESWHMIDEQVLKRLSDTMPHRVQAVLLVDGYYTKY
jgi:transposase